MLSQENIVKESNGPGELNDTHALLEKVKAARGRVGAALHRRLELLAASRLLETSDGVQALIQEIGVDGGFRAIFKEGKLDLSIGVSQKEGDKPGNGSLKSLPVHCGLQSVASGPWNKLHGTLTALDVSGHTNLARLPVAEFVAMTSLTSLECRGCPGYVSSLLETPEGVNDLVSLIKRRIFTTLFNAGKLDFSASSALMTGADAGCVQKLLEQICLPPF